LEEQVNTILRQGVESVGYQDFAGGTYIDVPYDKLFIMIADPYIHRIIRNYLPQHSHQIIIRGAHYSLVKLRHEFREIQNLISEMRRELRRLTCYVSVPNNKIEIVSFEEDEPHNSSSSNPGNSSNPGSSSNPGNSSNPGSSS
ncbi:13480_t:CDS:2, partial [Racocetra fulgida]